MFEILERIEMGKEKRRLLPPSNPLSFEVWNSFVDGIKGNLRDLVDLGKLCICITFLQILLLAPKGAESRVLA